MSEEEKSYELKRMHDRNLYLNKQLKERDKEIERLNNIIKEQGLEDKPNYYVKGLEGSLKEYQEEIERLNNILDRLGLLDKDIDKETKIVNMTITLPKWLKDIGKKNKINFSKLLQESLYEVLQIGSGKE